MGEGQITALSLAFMQAPCRTAWSRAILHFIFKNVSDAKIKDCSDKSIVIHSISPLFQWSVPSGVCCPATGGLDVTHKCLICFSHYAWACLTIACLTFKGQKADGEGHHGGDN